MRICTKHGSALFLCIVSSVALAICGIFAQAARYRMIEAEVFRALTAQINAILVRGGGEMSSRYGLRCYEAGPDDLAVFSRLTERLAGVDMARTLPQSPVRDPGVLTGAVDIFMRYRLPAILTAQIVQRIQSVSQEIRSATSSMPDIGSGESKGATIGKAVSDWLISFDFSGYLGVAPETASDENPKTPPPEESGEESSGGSPAADTIRERIQAFLLDRILGEDLLRELQRIQNCLVRYQAGEAVSESSGFRFPDMLDPEAVSS
ncbi:MAG TPA: hypothetical protein VIL27_00645, partial [Clostridia bacterium]